MTRQDVMAAFGEKAYLLIERGDKLAGVAGWQVENLVTRIDELYFEPGLAARPGHPGPDGSRRSRPRPSCRARPPCSSCRPTWRSTPAPGVRSATSRRRSRGWACAPGKKRRSKSMPRGASLWFKRLREDRVLRPM